MRRLLENGANTSFVNRIVDESLPIKDLVADPVDTVRGFASIPHPRIPQPVGLFEQVKTGEQRKNSMGVNFGNDNELRALAEAVAKVPTNWSATPLVPGAKPAGETQNVTDPSDRRRVIGTKQQADAATVERALTNAVAAQPAWDHLPAASRAKILEYAADLLEQRRARVRRAARARSRQDAAGRDFRSARSGRHVPLLRRDRAQTVRPSGRTCRARPANRTSCSLHGRGVFVCISPWNFPLAIFTGQVAAGLAAGNAVIAKPADQTVLIGHAAVKLLHEAGVPEGVLQFVPGKGFDDRQHAADQRPKSPASA